MQKNEEMSVIIIDESIVESSVLITLLSSLTRDIVISTSYNQGLNAMLAVADRGEAFDLVFLSLPPVHHWEYDTALNILSQAMQNRDPFRTIILGGQKLPPQISSKVPEDSGVICKPITREKIQDVLAPLGIVLPKLNCWEYMDCGREPNGRNVEELGVCPSASKKEADGLHGGENAGRVCWAVSGTMCGGKSQGSFVGKIKDCLCCDFYQVVKTEEGEKFESIDSILNRLKRKKGV